MATTTPLLGLRKPVNSDLINVNTDISDNMDKIDRASTRVLGYAQITTAQGGITSTAVDLAGLTVTVTVGTTRRVRVSFLTYPSSTVANDAVITRIVEGATQLQGVDHSLTQAARGHTQVGSVILTPSAGSHTYKLTMQRAAGSGVVTNNATSIAPSHIIVEDIGPV